MKKPSWVLVLLGLALAAGLAMTASLSSPALAAPNPQMTNFPTPRG